MLINPFDSSMANTEGFARTYDAGKPPTPPLTTPDPTRMANPSVGTVPDPSGLANHSVGTAPNPTHLANRRVPGCREPSRWAKSNRYKCANSWISNRGP